MPDPAIPLGQDSRATANEPLFGDTFYFLALLNPRDARHQAAVEFSRAHGRSVVTTEWVLTERRSWEQQKIGEALTADHHFEQAGFVALLKPRE